MVTSVKLKTPEFVSHDAGSQAARRPLVFILLWVGQLISLTGSGLTGFSLGIWAYQRTGSTTQYALIFTFTILPTIIISPFAGSVVDRWDRRRALIASHIGVGAITSLLLLLLLSGQLQVWHIYITTALQAVLNTFQWLALSAAVTLVAPAKHLGRAAGMTQLSEAVARVIAPILAGVLLLRFGLWGVLAINSFTAVAAMSTLLFVRIPKANPESAEKLRHALRRDISLGWSYVTAHKGLLSLLVLFALTNFLSGTVIVLSTPFILSFASVATLGTILSVAGGGMVAGGLVMSAWGGPKQRVYAVIGFQILAGLSIVIAGMSSSPVIVGATTFVFALSVSSSLAASQAIWQSKVEPGLQGRVFAVRRMIAWSTLPIAYLLAGPLADKVFNPLLVAGGPLAASVGHIVGVGPGRGIGLLFVFLGSFVVLISAVAVMSPHLRLLEQELPDIVVPRPQS